MQFCPAHPVTELQRRLVREEIRSGSLYIVYDLYCPACRRVVGQIGVLKPGEPLA